MRIINRTVRNTSTEDKHLLSILCFNFTFYVFFTFSSLFYWTYDYVNYQIIEKQIFDKIFKWEYLSFVS